MYRGVSGDTVIYMTTSTRPESSNRGVRAGVYNLGHAPTRSIGSTVGGALYPPDRHYFDSEHRSSHGSSSSPVTRPVRRGHLQLFSRRTLFTRKGNPILRETTKSCTSFPRRVTLRYFLPVRSSLFETKKTVRPCGHARRIQEFACAIRMALCTVLITIARFE